MNRELNINERIRAREVRVIDEKGEQVGVMSTPEALRLARERGLDLVEVAPNSIPPVCRFLDYGKFKYEQTKKDREARKGQRITEVKEIRFRPKIDDHDIDFKTRQAQKFLEGGDKVKISVLFRGREMAHPHLGRELLLRVAEALKPFGVMDRLPLMEGRTMAIVLSPVATAPAPAPAAAAAGAKKSEA